MAELRIVRASGDAEVAYAQVGPLLDEYVAWGVGQLGVLGLQLDASAVAELKAAFRAEFPILLGPRGRLLIAEADGLSVGVIALKPVDAETAEVKRMYVQPPMRGCGLGRRLLSELLDQAAGLGYRRVRLETAVFMGEAHGLYLSMGFTEVEKFPGGESERSGFDRHMRYLVWTNPVSEIQR